MAGACCDEPEPWRRLAAGPIFRWRMVRRRAPRHARGLDPCDFVQVHPEPVVSQTLSLSNGSLSSPSKRRRPYIQLQNPRSEPSNSPSYFLRYLSGKQHLICGHERQRVDLESTVRSLALAATSEPRFLPVRGKTCFACLAPVRCLGFGCGRRRVRKYSDQAGNIARCR